MTSFNDPIAEMLTKIRNALMAEHLYVDMEVSKMRNSIAQILKKNGFIENFLVSNERKKMRIFLKYKSNRQSIIAGLRRISKPGLRKYIGWQQVPTVLGGIGIAVVSTSKGVMDGKEARYNKVGGEILCTIW